MQNDFKPDSSQSGPRTRSVHLLRLPTTAPARSPKLNDAVIGATQSVCTERPHTIEATRCTIQQKRILQYKGEYDCDRNAARNVLYAGLTIRAPVWERAIARHPSPHQARLSLDRVHDRPAHWHLTLVAIIIATKSIFTDLAAIMIDITLMSPAELSAELGTRLKKRRLSLRMTQEELSKRTGLNVGTVKNLEAKTSTCTLDTLIRIVSVLGLANQFDTLFVVSPKSIAQMEQAATAPRLRARRSLQR